MNAVLFNADMARKLAQTVNPNTDTFDTVMDVVIDKILKEAGKGLYSVRLQSIPLVPEVKKALKARGFNVAAYKSNDPYNPNDFSGEIDVSW